MARLFLAGTLLISTALGYFSLSAGHDWGDDFAQYILQAQSVAQGTPHEFSERNSFAIDNSTQIIGPHVYRWGYPLCLAPFFCLSACDLLTLKCLNLVFFELALLCVYALFVPRIGRAASCLLVAMLAFNPNLLAFLDNLLSDTPFLFLAAFSLFLIDRLVVRGQAIAWRAEPRKGQGFQGAKARKNAALVAAFARTRGASNRRSGERGYKTRETDTLEALPRKGSEYVDSDRSRGSARRLNGSLSYVFLGVCIFAAMLVRANGVLLLPVLFVCQVLDTRSGSLRWRPLSWSGLSAGAIPYAVCLVLKGITGLLLPDGSAGYASVAAAQVSWWGIGDNAAFYLGMISMLFGVFPEKEILFAFTLPFLFLGMKARWRLDLPWLAFCLANHLLYVVWPGRGSMRFIMPMMPFYLYFMFQGAAFLWTKRFASADGQNDGDALAASASWWRAGGFVVAALLAGSFLAESAYLAYHNMQDNRRIAGPYDDNSTEMFEYVKRHTAADARLLFFKPRAMLLLAGRRAFASRRIEDLAKVDYQVIHKKLDPCNQVARPAADAENVFENSTFVVFRLRRD